MEKKTGKVVPMKSPKSKSESDMQIFAEMLKDLDQLISDHIDEDPTTHVKSNSKLKSEENE